MAVTTKTQSEQASPLYTHAPEAAATDEQSLRDEFKEASQHFFRTLFRVGVHLTLAPVYLLPRDPRGHFVSAGREFTRGLTTLASRSGKCGKNIVSLPGKDAQQPETICDVGSSCI